MDRRRSDHTASSSSSADSATGSSGSDPLPLRLTATTWSARAAVTGATGTGSSSPPSTSTRPFKVTGVMNDGMAEDARMATSSGPRWNQTSRWASRSTATAVNGTGRSSMATSPSSSPTTRKTRSPRTAPGLVMDRSMRRRTLPRDSPVAHSA